MVTATRTPRCASFRTLRAQEDLSMAPTSGPTPGRRKVGGSAGRVSRRTAVRSRSRPTVSLGRTPSTRRLVPSVSRSRAVSGRISDEGAGRPLGSTEGGRVSPSRPVGTGPTPTCTRDPPSVALVARRVAISVCFSQTASGVLTCRDVVAPAVVGRSTLGAAISGAVAPSGGGKRAAGLVSTSATASPEVGPTAVAPITRGRSSPKVATGRPAAIATTGVARRRRNGVVMARTAAGGPGARSMGRAPVTLGPSMDPGPASSPGGARAAARRRRRVADPRRSVSGARTPTRGRSTPRTG